MKLLKTYKAGSKLILATLYQSLMYLISFKNPDFNGRLGDYPDYLHYLRHNIITRIEKTHNETN